MKIICFGTPSFTSEIIKNIERCNDIVCIVTTEDTQKGRGKKMLPSDVKKIAIELDIPILQPNKLDDKEFIEKLKEYNAVHHHQIFFQLGADSVANLDLLAKKYQLEDMKEDISLLVANSYLQILFNKEQQHLGNILEMKEFLILQFFNS